MIFGVMMICTYLAIINAPIGDVVTIISAHPFITALFATILFLHQMPSCIKLITGILVTFAIILMINQDENVTDFGYYMALTASLLTSLYNLCLTYSHNLINPSLLAFWSGLVGLGQCFILTLFVPDLPVMIVHWQLPDSEG